MSQLTAQEARAAMLEAQSMDGVYLRAETDTLLSKIADAAKHGKSELGAGRLDPVVESRPRTLGYKVKWTDGYDQRDPGYTTISW
jgi:hypothetical protein